jgi:hypothetical protein
MASLIAYRMAKGLCKKCGEKWSKTHQHATSIQLNVLQKIWDLFDHVDTKGQEDLVSKQLYLAISEAVVTGKDVPRTLKIRGSIQDIQVLILLDYGSSHSFISEEVAGLLKGVICSSNLTKVKVANGTILHSSIELGNAEWFIQGYAFFSDLKVLPLQNLDMVGAWIDWKDSL